MNGTARPAAAVVAMLLLIPACAGAAHSISWDENGLNYYFATTKDTFVMYENVPMQYIVTNTSAETLLINHPCVDLQGIAFIVWAPGTPWHPDPWAVWDRAGCQDSSWEDEFAPGETYVRQVTWGMQDQVHGGLITRAGTYRLDGEFRAWVLPSNEYVGHAFSLDIHILSGAAGVADDPLSWGVIKALYR